MRGSEYYNKLPSLFIGRHIISNSGLLPVHCCGLWCLYRLPTVYYSPDIRITRIF